MTAFLPLFAVSVATAAAGDLLPAQGLVWQWMPAEDRRFYLENEVVLPDIMWWFAQHNKEARVIAWQLRTVLNCDEIELEGRHSWDVSCRIEDIAVLAAAMPGDQASPERESIVEPILAEIDARLSGTRLDFTLRDDGRIVRVALPDLTRTEHKVGVMNENLRSVLQRAIAGFDLQLPRGGQAPDGAWMQRESILFMAPNQTGTMGAAEILHGVRRQDGDTLLVQTVGKGTVAPIGRGAAAAGNMYLTTVNAAALFDTRRGLLVERTWALEGRPTAGSAVSEGWMGVPYMQSGFLRLLAPDASPDLGPTREVAPPGQTPNAQLQQWTAMGAGPAGGVR